MHNIAKMPQLANPLYGIIIQVHRESCCGNGNTKRDSHGLFHIKYNMYDAWFTRDMYQFIICNLADINLKKNCSV